VPVTDAVCEAVAEVLLVNEGVIDGVGRAVHANSGRTASAAIGGKSAVTKPSLPTST
jgi:hypothetical protein